MKKIVLSGKGGAGKTTVAAELTKLLAKKDNKHRVLVVDADAAMTLPFALGIKSKWDDLKPLGEFETEDGEDTERVLAQIQKDYVKKVDQDGLQFDFAYMGHHKMNSCLCGYNSALNLFLDLAREHDLYDFAIVDREAGIEHLTRSVYGKEDDYLMLVSWLSPDYLSVIERINDVADVIGSTEKRLIIVNDILGSADDDSSSEAIEKVGLSRYPYTIMKRNSDKSVDSRLINDIARFIDIE
ncbi:MAG: AAA family ATPase [Candidatus Dojkabacteria bacterium]|nr:MAG: AAA family ATPase [Candidatus Dojkabacteria bacterium]